MEIQEDEVKQTQCPPTIYGVSKDAGIQPGMQAKLPPLLKRYSQEQIEEAIEKNYGITTAICNQLDCTMRQFQQTASYLKIRHLIDESKRQLTSIAESVLLEALLSDNQQTRLDAAKFALSRLGKYEGWSSSPDVQVAVEVSPEDKKASIRAIFGIQTENKQDGQQ